MRSFIVLFAVLVASAQQTPEVLVHQDFETDPTVWSAVGLGSSVSITHLPGQAHSGNSALAFSYQLKRGQIAAAVTPASPKLAKMQRLRFWVKTDHDTPGAVLLSETKPGGGNYTAWFWAPANTWQQIEMSPADFVLSDGPQDPKDADGKLDLDQLQGVGILDLGLFFPAVPSAAPANAGAHTMFIDDFEALGGPASAAPSSMQI